MHRLIQPTFVVRYFPLKEFKNHFYCSWTKSADHFTTADERKHMSLNSENILGKCNVIFNSMIEIVTHLVIFALNLVQ